MRRLVSVGVGCYDGERKTGPQTLGVAMGNLDTNTIRLGFLGQMSFSKGDAFRGGILVVDGNGKPVEFRCTSPVKPNTLQRALYGNSMMPHIATELMGLPLLKTLQEKPTVVLVEEETFLGVRQQIETPVFHILRKNGSSPDKDGAFTISSSSAAYEPIVVVSHVGHAADKSVCQQMLTEAFNRIDLCEPFARLHEAISYVQENRILED